MTQSKHLLQHSVRTARGHKRPSPELERMLKLVNSISDLESRQIKVQLWKTTLRAIARREHFISIELEIVPDWSKGTFTVERDRLGIELDKIDIRYIRECLICDRIYLAPRLTYDGGELKHCSEKCARVIRNERYKAKKMSGVLDTDEVVI